MEIPLCVGREYSDIYTEGADKQRTVDFYFYPVMDEIPKTVRAVCLYGCVLVFMTLPTLLEIKEKLQWNYLKSKI